MNKLTPWRGDFFEEMRRDMDEMMRRFFGPLAPAEGDGAKTVGMWAPRVDVSETDKAYVVKADLPGVEPKDVEVSVHEGILSLKGEKKEEKEEKGKNFHRVERFEGQFYREIPLPGAVDSTAVEANAAKGVVTVTIPKKPTPQPRKIAVKE
jgi:HSP20 family protein